MAHLLNKLFGVGNMPKELGPLFSQEPPLVADEGISGRLLTRNLKAPRKRVTYRRQGFAAYLAITDKRFLAYVMGRRAINVGLDDPRLAEITITHARPGELGVRFDPGVFDERMSGDLDYLFRTEHAGRYFEKLRDAGAKVESTHSPSEF